jgi:eukaryotic-like serine/threonine-protein kinase
VEFGAGFALALVGEISAAQAIASDLEKRFPQDSFVQFTYLPVLRALFTLKRGEAVNAIESLDRALPYEQAAPGSEFIGLFGGTYSAYVRGEAYRAQRMPAEAAREFQKIVDHRGLVNCDPIDALARLELARSLISSGAIDKGRSAYQDLFTLWRGADANLPVPSQAREEYLRLR